MLCEARLKGGYAMYVWQEKTRLRMQARRRFWVAFRIGLFIGILLGIHACLIIGTWSGWI